MAKSAFEKWYKEQFVNFPCSNKKWNQLMAKSQSLKEALDNVQVQITVEETRSLNFRVARMTWNAAKDLK